MALRSRLRQFDTKHASTRIKAEYRPARIDTWLVRSSHVSQLGLFIITIGAIYFTVIPLYQKALLDEQIARKQIELDRVQNLLSAAYVKIRAEVVRRFVFDAGAECSGLMLTDKEIEKFRDSYNNKPNQAKAILAISPKDCLAGQVDKNDAMSELSTVDFVYFKAQVSRLAIELENSRAKALDRLNRAEKTVKLHPELVRPAEAFGPGTVGALYVRQIPLERRQKFLEWVAVESEQHAAANEYSEIVKEALLKLHEIEWPAPSN